MAIVLKNPPPSGGRHKRLGFDPWVRKIPRRRPWQFTPVFLPGESHGQWSLMGYSSWNCKELDMTKATEHTRMHVITFGTTWIIQAISLWWGVGQGWLVLCKMFPSNSIFSLYPQDAMDMTTLKCHNQMSPGGQLSPIEKHWPEAKIKRHSVSGLPWWRSG